jgi:hypothetical protein
MTKKLKFYLPFDLYTMSKIPMHSRTIEYIIPKYLLQTDIEKKDFTNLFITHDNIHTFKNNYKYGGSFKEIRENISKWKTYQGFVFKNDEKKLFFPMHGRPLIAHTCLSMFQKYPYLCDSYFDIFDDEYRIDEWLDEPFTHFDKNILSLKEFLYYQGGRSPLVVRDEDAIG